MYRGRSSSQGGYPHPYSGRSSPSGRPYNPPAYRDDRGRSRTPYQQGYHDHGPSDPYRRSTPRRRYPSPAPSQGSHRGGGESRGRERSPPSRGGGIPLDHNLVITVGNELTGSGPPRHLHPPDDRDDPHRPGFDHSGDRGSRRRSPSRGRSHPRSCSRDRSRSRAASHRRSKSRPQSPSLDRSRAKSRGRSKSRARSRSRSPDRSRGKSRGRSKSRLNSRSRTRSRSRSRSRSRDHHRMRSRSRSVSTSSTSSSSESSHDSKPLSKEFRELKQARRRREVEELLTQPTKSILKKRVDTEDSPSVRSMDSPRDLDTNNISRVAEKLLTAVKGMEPHMLSSMLAELQADPQMAQRAGLDAEITGILELLESQAGAKGEAKDDIEDEEKFLYGDSEDSKPLAAPEVSRQHSFSELYGDVTEEALYGDFAQPHTSTGQTYNLPTRGSTHLQATLGTEHLPKDSSMLQQGDVRYNSKPTITPDQNITVQVSNPIYPPGMEPLEESERRAVEEYEKIQDLLKTIGLDLGVVEISKMAARTKERLHGNKPPPKTPTRWPDKRKRHYSSGSSEGNGRRKQRSGSESSGSSKSSRGRSREKSWSGDNVHHSKTVTRSQEVRTCQEEIKADRRDWGHSASKEPPPQIPDPNSMPPQPAAPIPPFGQTQIHSVIPPNYPPPGYGQYGTYMPYVHQQWPPMYPPPGMAPPPQASHEEYSNASPYDRLYNKPIQPEAAVKVPSVMSRESAKGSSHDRRVSEEENNESQKLKVLEEQEKLRQEREIRMKKKEYLLKELERLRKQQGELLRKKRREKDGHKDPLLSEISQLQEEVMNQISYLRKEHEEAEKKRTEVEKVALILGLKASDRPGKTTKTVAQEAQPSAQKRRDCDRSPKEAQLSNTTVKSTVSTKVEPDKAKLSITASAPSPAPPPEPFEYYDAGNHWCKNCNITSGSMFDFFTHLHCKSHRKTQDPYNRPWAPSPTKTGKDLPSEEKLAKPAKGSEFLLPVRGFFCLLCKEFYGDAICAEEHVTTHAHNEKYKKQMYENPLYEQRRNLDRQAGLALEATGKKRKHEEEEDRGSKEKEEKSKHKKEKKDKKKEEEKKDEKLKVKKEQDGDQHKLTRKEEDPKPTKREEEERCVNKKDERARHTREQGDEEKAKCSRRDEEERFRYNKEEDYRYRARFNRGDDHSRHDDDKYRSNKYSDFRSKYGRDRDEGKPKLEKETKPLKKEESKKIAEAPPKPYDPPKVLCGPSPAMRAKLRKQSAETGKNPPIPITSTFGKFTWKKKENVLAKEAERAAAEFLKDEEEPKTQDQMPAEDSFAKSMAVAKEIALKLSGHSPTPPPWVSQGANRGRIRPNLPAPAMVLRKTAMFAKPAPLNTFLSIRPQNNNTDEPPPPQETPLAPEAIANEFDGQNAPVEETPEIEQKPNPNEKMIMMEPDVAVPGVPESEQTRAVFVKPPPFMNLGDGAQRSDKLKTNLAAAKAKDLFDIFYSNIGQPGHSAITRPKAVPRAQGKDTKKNESPPAQGLETQQASQPQPQKTLQSKPEQPQTQLTSAPQTAPESKPVEPKPTMAEPQPLPKKTQIELSAASTSEPAPSYLALQSKQTESEPTESTKIQIEPIPQPKIQLEPIPQPHPKTNSEKVSQTQSEASTSKSQPPSQDLPAVLMQTPQPEPQLAPQIQTDLQPAQVQSEPASESQTQSTLLQVSTPPDDSGRVDSEPQSQLTPKAKTKTSPQSKKTSPPSHPVRQTRSQTRYQTRRQQQQQSQAELESDMVLENPEQEISDLKALEVDQFTGSVLEESPTDTFLVVENPDETKTITPETLGLPSDMMSLGFEYDFNFE